MPHQFNNLHLPIEINLKTSSFKSLCKESSLYRGIRFVLFSSLFFASLCFFLQVIGSIVGVRHIIDTFPEVGLGPRLSVDIHRGALTEGLLTFVIVIVSLGLSRNIPGSFFMKTWISSVSKLTLHILGSDLTGGCMNPASVST